MTSKELSALDVRACASLFKTDSVEQQLPQSQERQQILQAWLETGIDLIGRQVVDLGCGQGDTVTVLGKLLQASNTAHRPKTPARLYGVDPGRLDYGAPYTLQEAQRFILEGALKDTVEFSQNDGPGFLEAHATSGKQPVDTVVMVHSIYYLPKTSTLSDIFRACRIHKVADLLLAEWSLQISSLDALPHLLSVLTQDISPEHEANIRTVFTPAKIVELANAEGYELVYEKVITPPKEMQDGAWETGGTRHRSKDLKQMEANNEEHRILQSFQTHLDALNAAVGRLPNGKVKETRCMDVWTGVLKLKEAK